MVRVMLVLGVMGVGFEVGDEWAGDKDDDDDSFHFGLAPGRKAEDEDEDGE